MRLHWLGVILFMWPMASFSCLQAWDQGCVLLADLTFHWRLTAWQWVSNTTEIETLPPHQKRQYCLICSFLLLSCLLVGSTSHFFVYSNKQCHARTWIWSVVALEGPLESCLLCKLMYWLLKFDKYLTSNNAPNTILSFFSDQQVKSNYS